MTSEVLLLNKHAVVLAADSAVTTTPQRNGEHPRYSKTANKLFELSDHGNVAVMIYGGAHIDCVPWELVIKLFRSNLAGARFPTADLYLEQLLAFVKANTQLFGPDLLTSLTDGRFESAVKYILLQVSDLDKSIFDTSVDIADRRAAWINATSKISADLGAKLVHRSLSETARDTELAKADQRATDLAKKLAEERELEAVDAITLTSLAINALYTSATAFLSSTGIVVAGYGEQEIFPGYCPVTVYGHIGNELLVEGNKSFQITHYESSMIKGWAQTTMIDVFTDGFGFPLWRIIKEQNRKGLYNLVKELQDAGAVIEKTVIDAAIDKVHQIFMKDWTAENYQENWQPLRSVLGSLGVQEMAHLAETLLTLQAVKERVTSSSESVGGPIDIAAITKSEGLVWLKRKHYFDADMNLRYTTRLQQSMQP